jgi:negative regulator of flagellin synthesis FlgM
MKIDGMPILPVTGSKEINRIKQTERKTSVSGEDELVVSEKANLFQSLLSKAKELPAFREELVKDLSTQITDGKFNVDVSKIARNILSQND